jgi:hypothetical protein
MMIPKLVVPRSKGQCLALAGVTILAIALLWVFPPVGFVACAVMLVIAPPWGRGLAERGFISLLIALGVTAMAFPRASGLPITPVSAHAALSLFTAVAVGLSLGGPGRMTRLIKPTLPDVLIGIFAAGAALWLMAAYIGRNAYQIVSGLFFTGWDNQGHFTPFANTIEVGSTTWPTFDGTIAWNQWYPSLHTTMWSLAQLASQTGSEILDRPGLLWPYVQWTGISFALSLAALAWVAGDLTRRCTPLVGVRSRFVRRSAPTIAVLAFAAFALLGSPTQLFNSGFTNFMMAVAVTTVTAYLSARSWRSARVLGWILIPLGALAVNALWTPLVLGLVPSAVIVLIALGRTRLWLAPVWAVASGAIVLGTVYLQSRAIVDVDPGASSSFMEDLGAIGAGMTPFNMGAAIVSPIIAVLVAIILIRSHRRPLAIAIAGPSVAICAFLWLTMSAADSAGLSRLGSYYVLKTLNALLLVNAPMFAAGTGIGIALVLAAMKRRVLDPSTALSVNRFNAVIVGCVIALVGVTSFGYVGSTPSGFASGFGSAPGLAAGAARAGSADNYLVGEAIIRARDAAMPYSGKTTMLWDGSGVLVNMWVASLNRVLSKDDHQFYRGLPPFPYTEETVTYVDFALGLHPKFDLALLWFRGVSGEQLATLKRQHPDRVTLVKVPMRSTVLCQECTL